MTPYELHIKKDTLKIEAMFSQIIWLWNIERDIQIYVRHAM